MWRNGFREVSLTLVTGHWWWERKQYKAILFAAFLKASSAGSQWAVISRPADQWMSEVRAENTCSPRGTESLSLTTWHYHWIPVKVLLLWFADVNVVLEAPRARGVRLHSIHFSRGERSSFFVQIREVWLWQYFVGFRVTVRFHRSVQAVEKALFVVHLCREFVGIVNWVKMQNGNEIACVVTPPNDAYVCPRLELPAVVAPDPMLRRARSCSPCPTHMMVCFPSFTNIIFLNRTNYTDRILR